MKGAIIAEKTNARMYSRELSSVAIRRNKPEVGYAKIIKLQGMMARIQYIAKEDSQK